MNYDIGYPHDIKVRRRSLPSDEAFYTLLLEVDQEKTKYWNTPFKELGDGGKRKVENLLIIKNSNERLKVIFR